MINLNINCCLPCWMMNWV